MSNAGRPETYDFEVCKEICSQVQDGENIKNVLKSKKSYPTFQTWCNWKRDHDELFDLYIKSIQDKAESIDNKIDETIEQLKSEKLSPSQANVIIQTLKWKAAKYYPKMFGEKAEIDITSKGESIKDISSISTEELVKRAEAIKTINGQA